MSFLFGHLYDTPCKFTHDQMMFQETSGDAGVVPRSAYGSPEDKSEQSAGKVAIPERGGCSSASDGSLRAAPSATKSQTRSRDHAELPHGGDGLHAAPVDPTTDQTSRKRRRSDEWARSERALPAVQADHDAIDVSGSARPTVGLQVPSPALNVDSSSLSSYEYSEAWKQQAFEAARGTGSSDWNDITLVSVSGHQKREEEL